MVLCRGLVEIEIRGAQADKWILECRLQKGHKDAMGEPSMHQIDPIDFVDLMPMEIFEFAREVAKLEEKLCAKSKSPKVG